MGKKNNHTNPQWYAMDAHLHTPASNDFQQPEVTFLDILQRAEVRGLDIIAFTDHNTIAGYRNFQDDIQQLELLEKLKRLLPAEKIRLAEYRRLNQKILILPGIEITATFGFHIIGLFSPSKPIREIEHLLLSVNIPAQLLDEGSSTVGATTDVLSIYRAINQAGGIVIAAHANSSNGVAMRGFNFGGQTKIAYTQDANLNALEVTDLEQKGGRTAAAFFNGTKPEYPRRMHCIQGSDSHRLSTDSSRKKNPGIGDRATDVLLPELTFDALKELFQSNDFARTRPRRLQEEPAYDFIQTALEEGANIIQDFHESITVRGGKLYEVLSDVCAFANTNGGTLYIGLAGEPQKPVIGVQDAEQSVSQIEKEINDRISPPLPISLDLHEYKGKKLIRILVPRGIDPPYALDDNKIYVRDEDETGLAIRDEIVGLVMRGKQIQTTQPTITVEIEGEVAKPIPHVLSPAEEEDNTAPRTGVEVVAAVDRKGSTYYTMRDLRNGNIVKNVTRASARRLWSYAIMKHSEITSSTEKIKIQWNGDFGLLTRRKQGKGELFDLVERTPGGIRYYFGVTIDGIHGKWRTIIGEEEAGS